MTKWKMLLAILGVTLLCPQCCCSGGGSAMPSVLLLIAFLLPQAADTHGESRTSFFPSQEKTKWLLQLTIMCRQV